VPGSRPGRPTVDLYCFGSYLRDKRGSSEVSGVSTVVLGLALLWTIECETYDRYDSNLIGGEGVVTEVNDEDGQDVRPENERTVTISGIPLLVAGVAAFLIFRWIRRRMGRRGSSAQ
jgi:hypothetical protein